MSGHKYDDIESLESESPMPRSSINDKFSFNKLNFINKQDSNENMQI